MSRLVVLSIAVLAAMGSAARAEPPGVRPQVVMDDLDSGTLKAGAWVEHHISADSDPPTTSRFVRRFACVEVSTDRAVIEESRRADAAKHDDERVVRLVVDLTTGRIVGARAGPAMGVGRPVHLELRVDYPVDEATTAPTALGSRDTMPFEEGKGLDCVLVRVEGVRGQGAAATTVKARHWYCAEVPFAYRLESIDRGLSRDGWPPLRWTDRPAALGGLVRFEEHATRSGFKGTTTITLVGFGTDATPRLRVK